MEQQDHRYPTIKPMLDQGRIKKLTDIFIYIPRTVLAQDIGKNLKRLNELLDRPENFTIKDLLLIGNLCGLSRREMLLLLDAEFEFREQNKVESKKPTKRF
jgi:hypothetical protein